MKIRYFVDVFPNLTETFVLNQITGLIERGFEVEIIAITPGNRDVVHPNVHKYALLQKTHYLFDHPLPASRFSRLLQLFARLCRYSGQLRLWRALFIRGPLSLQMRIYLACAVATSPLNKAAGLTIAHFGPSAVFAARLQRLGLLSGPVLPVFHGFDLSEKQVLTTNQHSYQQLFKNCPLLLTISQHWAEKLVELGCAPDKIKINRMGINCDVFDMRDANTPLQVPLRLLTVARLTEKKGLIYAIEALAKLKAQGFTATLHIIGTGPLQAELAAAIDTFQLQESVQLLGAKNQTEVRSALQQADVFLLPSVTAANGDKEGIPVSLMEAMASGILCLSTYHSGIPELIRHGENGLLVNERDSEALCQQLIALIQGQLDIRMLRQNARQKVTQDFNQQQIYDDLAMICRELGASLV